MFRTASLCRVRTRHQLSGAPAVALGGLGQLFIDAVTGSLPSLWGEGVVLANVVA